MGNIQVTTRPQAIYPDGAQDSFTIRNNGPYTIYVDADSSVNSSSLPVPPTGTLAWDNARALWFIGDPNMPAGQFSSVSITRNSQVAVFGNETDAILYTAKSADNVTFAPFAVNTSPIIDCSAWETLRILIKVIASRIKGQGDEYAIGDQMTLAVRWYDSQLNDIGVDNYLLPYPSSEQPLIAGAAYRQSTFSTINPQSRASVPVRGTYFQAQIVLAQNELSLFTVIGTTRSENAKTCFTPYDVLPHWGGGLAALPEYDALTSDSWGSFSMVALGFPNIYLPGVKPRVHITFKTNQTVITAGSLRFRSFMNTNIAHARDIAIPAVAGGTITEADLELPVDQPTQMSWGVIPQAAGPANIANFYFHLQYLD